MGFRVYKVEAKGSLGFLRLGVLWALESRVECWAVRLRGFGVGGVLGSLFFFFFFEFRVCRVPGQHAGRSASATKARNVSTEV